MNNNSFIGPLQDEVDIFINQYFDEDDNYIGPVRENISEEINNQLNSTQDNTSIGDGNLMSFNNSIQDNNSIQNSNSIGDGNSMSVNNSIQDVNSIGGNSISENRSSDENINSKKRKLNETPKRVRKKNPKYI